MAIVVNGPGTPGPEGPQGPTGPAGTLSSNTGISIGGTLEMSGHIVPTETNTYNLGDTNAYFQDLYIGTGSIIMMSTDGKAAKLSMDSDGELKYVRQNRATLQLGSSVQAGFKGTTTKFTTTASTGDKGQTGSTGCGNTRNYKFGGMTEDAQGLYTKGKFWTIDNGGDAGATFMNFDSIIINNWEDEHCNRNFCYQMNALPYCARIDIFPQGFSGGNQPWARFFYAGHYGVGGCTQSGGISAGYHRFDIDTNHPIHSMNSPSGGSAAFVLDDEYEIRFFPMCSGDSDTDDGASGGSGGSSGGDDGGGGTVDPPAPTYPCIRRRSRPRFQGFTLENGIGSLEGYFALGGSGASGANAGGAIVSINSITEMYVNNFAGAAEGFINDNAFLTTLNQNGRVTVSRNNGASSDTWARYNYSAIGTSGGTGDGGYVRFIGMTLDTFGPDGATFNATLRVDRINNLCFEDNFGATCNDTSRQYIYRGITTSIALPGGSNTGEFFLYDSGNDQGATFGGVQGILIDDTESSPCSRNNWGFFSNISRDQQCGTVSILPNGQTPVGEPWVRYYYGPGHEYGGGSGLLFSSIKFNFDDHTIGNHVESFDGASGATAMLEIGKSYDLSFTPSCNQGDGGGGSGGVTQNPPPPAWPSTYRYGATQGATANRDPGVGYYGVSGASVGFTSLLGGATVADVRFINGFYVDNYSPMGDGSRYDGDFFESLAQTGQLTLTRMSGATTETWAKYNYTHHAGTGGTGGYRIFSGMTLAGFGPTGETSYGGLHIPLEKSGSGVVPWNMNFQDVAGYTCEDNKYVFTFKGITNSSVSNVGFKNSIGTGDLWFYDSSYDAGATFGQIKQVFLDKFEDAPCNRNMFQEIPMSSGGNVRFYPEDYNGLTSDTWVQYYYSHRTLRESNNGYAWFYLDSYPNSAVRAFNGPSGGTAMLEVGKRYHVSFHPEKNEHEDNDGGSGGSTAHPDAPAYPCTYRYGATQGATANRDPGNAFYGVSGASVGYSSLHGGATVADIRFINGFYVDNYAADGDGARYDGDFFESLSQTGQLTLTRSNGGTAELWAKYNYTYHAGTGGTGGYRIFSGMTLAAWGPSGGATAGSHGDYAIPLERTNVGVVPWNMCFQDVAGYTCEDNSYTFTFRGITSAVTNPFKAQIGTGDMWFVDTTYDAGATFGQMRYVFLDRNEDGPCNRDMNQEIPLNIAGNVRLYPEDYNGLTSDTWVQYYYNYRFVANSESRFYLDNYPNSAVRAFNGPSGGTAMLEVGKRYHVSFHPEVNEGEDNDGSSGGSTAHPDAPAYPCTYRYGATQGATAYRDPGQGFYGVSGASVGFTTLGGGATVADIRFINELFIDTYAPDGDGARYDGDWLSGLDQTGKVTLTRMSGATSEVWARFTYDTHGNSLGTGGFHHFQGVTLDTWGPTGGNTSGSYGDYAIPMERTNLGVVPWKMMFENTAVTGPTASLGTNQFSFHYKVGTGDSKPGTGFFKLGTTGAEDSLGDSEFLYLDNLEENGEYGTGRYIGDFMDTLDNSGTITITPHTQVAGQQWVKYFYTTQVQGITSEGGSAGYHKVLGLSAMYGGNWNGNSFGSGIQSGYATGPFMIEFNDSVAQTEWEYINIQGPRDFAETGLAYSVLEKGYPVTIESMRGRLGTGGGCTGTFYRNAMQSNPVPGISGVGFRNGGYNYHHASTAGNTFSGGNTLAADETLFLNLTGFTLSGSTGNPNYFSGYVKFRRTDGS